MLVNKNNKNKKREVKIFSKKDDVEKNADKSTKMVKSQKPKFNQIVKKSNEVSRKRKISSDDEDTCKKAKVIKKNKDVKCGDEKSECEEDDIVSNSDKESADEEMVTEKAEISNKDEKMSAQQLKNQMEVEKRKEYNADQILKRKQEMKIKKEEGMKGIKEMFLDTPKVESESLKEQIHKRLVDRMNKTIVMTNIPNKFTINDAKALVPDMVSCVIPYNIYYHKIGGTVYIDVDSHEKASKIADKLRNTELKGRKPLAMVQTKIIDNVDKYNCQRLVLSNLSSKTTTEQIKAVFTNAIRVEILPVKGIDKKMSVTAFAEYESVEEAIADYDSKHGALVNDCQVNVKFQFRKEANIKDKTHLFDKKRLTVMGVKENATIEEFKRCFPKSSKIQPAFSKGMAHVVYTNVEDCANDKALVNTFSPPSKWRVSYAIGGPNVKETVPPIKKISEKAPRPMKKEGGDKKSQKKFGDRKFGKKFPGDKKGGNKVESQFERKPDSLDANENAKEMARSNRKNDLCRKEKRKLKKERQRIIRAENLKK